MKNKLVRITTVPLSLEKLLENQLRFMKGHYEVTAISADRFNLERAGKLQEVQTFHVEMTRKITPWQDLKAVWQLYNYFKKEKPFIVHTHTPKAGTLGMLASKLAGVPHRLHTIAGLPLLETAGLKRKLLNAVEKATYNCATRIYPNSYGLKEIIIQEQFCRPNKLKVLANGSSNGIDTTYFNPENFSAQQNQHLRNNLGIHPNDFVFIFVGRLVGDKGINELVSAFKKVKSQKSKVESQESNLMCETVNSKFKIHNLKLLLVGTLETDLDPLHKNTLEEIEDNPNIISVGFQNDVRPYLAISDCLVFPSYREGFPNVVMQAGAMGLPSIVSNINGCNEIIEEGKNGIIIPVKNSEALYEAIKKMIDDVPLRVQLKQNARGMIVSRFEQKILWDAILAEYKSLEVTLSLEKIKNTIIRTSTVAISLDYLLKGQLSFLQNNYEVLAVSGNSQHLEEVANREGVKVNAIEMQRNISPIKDLKSLWHLYRLFKKEKPLIVHSITPKAGLLSMIAAKMAFVPIRVHTFTGLVFPTKKGKIRQLLILMDRLLCECATNIYPEGQGVRNDLIKYRITNKPLKVIANGNVNGIDAEHFNQELFSSLERQTMKIKLGITADEFVFIFVGRLVGDKGINELTEAFRKISKDIEKVKLLLVGPFEPDLDPLATTTLQEIKANSNIISVGFQKDVRSYLAISNCLALPSYREGFPNVVMQAGAMGLPSIVTNINGCNEIIIEGKNGIIIPVKSSEALYEAMKKMIENIHFRMQLQKNARQMIVSRYEQNIVWDAILTEYKKLEAKS